MTGFAIGPTTMPCTKGLWIWGEPIKISEDTVLIIMDTEGLNSVRKWLSYHRKRRERGPQDIFPFHPSFFCFYLQLVTIA